MSATWPKTYTGSCHCGLTKYTIQLTLPPTTVTTKPYPPEVLIRKCNCTTCHKLSMFHIRLPNPPEQFQLLSPISTSDTSISGGLLVGPHGLTDYVCNDKQIHWYFCSCCGVRCFAFSGEGEVRPLPSSSTNTGVLAEGEEKQVWSPKREGWNKDSWTSSLTVNATTLDAKQQGLDLREWHEKKWIMYIDCLGEDEADDEPARTERPHEGGTY